MLIVVITNCLTLRRMNGFEKKMQTEKKIINHCEQEAMLRRILKATGKGTARPFNRPRELYCKC